MKEDLQEFKINLSMEERIKCLQEIIRKIKRILYVYEKSLEPDSNYNYRIYCGGILLYVSSSNTLFNGELINILINVNSILSNKMEKEQLKKIVFETKNNAEYLLREEYKKGDINGIG